MSTTDILSTSPVLFSRQLFTDLQQQDHIPLDEELEQYVASIVSTCKLLEHEPNWLELRRMRVATLAYLGTDLINSPEYLAMHEFTRSWQHEFTTRLDSQLPSVVTSVNLKTAAGISILKAPYNETATTENMETVVLGTYAAYTAVAKTGEREVVLARILMAPATFALEHIIVGDFKDAFISRDPRSKLILDAELLPRLLGGPTGYDGIRITPNLGIEGTYVMANCVNFAYKHGGAVYVFNDCLPDTKVYYIFDTLDDYNRGIGNFWGKNPDGTEWLVLIAYKRLPEGANVQAYTVAMGSVVADRAMDENADEADQNADTDLVDSDLLIDSDYMEPDSDAQTANVLKDNEHIDMAITKFSLRKPDSDGDMYANIEVAVRNTTESVIRLIRTDTIFLNKDGIIVSGDADNYVHENLAVGEVTTFEANGRYIKATLGAAPATTLVRAFTTLYSREVHKLGDIAILQSNKSYTPIRKTVNSNTIGSAVTAAVSYHRDDDGKIKIAVCCGLTNITDRYLDKVVLKTYLLDSEDVELENSEQTRQLPPQSSICIEDSFWNVNNNAIRDGKCRLFLAVYTPVALKTCEAPSTLATRD